MGNQLEALPPFVHDTSIVPSVCDTSTVSSQLDPYVLHHCFGPATVLVTQQLTGANNYNSWSRAMLIALSAKNKIGFVDGMIMKPNDNLLAA